MATTRPPPWASTTHVVGPEPSVSQEGAHLVVWLRGEHDMSTAVALAQTLAEAAAAGDGDLAVDLSQVEFMDATIVTTLIHSRDVLRTSSRHLTLRAPSPPALRILNLCGLLSLIDP
jgi:anti-sigma B factor antagonist